MQPAHAARRFVVPPIMSLVQSNGRVAGRPAVVDLSPAALCYLLAVSRAGMCHVLGCATCWDVAGEEIAYNEPSDRSFCH